MARKTWPTTYKNSKEEDVRRLYNAGLTVIEISRVLNLSRQGVYAHLHKLGLALPSERESVSK